MTPPPYGPPPCIPKINFITHLHPNRSFKPYEAQVIPALLFKSESWIGLTDTHISDLQNFQDNFVRKLLRLPPSTPKAIVHWDSGMKLMKWRIAEKKLLFFRKIMLKLTVNTICRSLPLIQLVYPC